MEGEPKDKGMLKSMRDKLSRDEFNEKVNFLNNTSDKEIKKRFSILSKDQQRDVLKNYLTKIWTFRFKKYDQEDKQYTNRMKFDFVALFTGNAVIRMTLDPYRKRTNNFSGYPLRQQKVLRLLTGYKCLIPYLIIAFPVLLDTVSLSVRIAYKHYQIDQMKEFVEE